MTNRYNIPPLTHLNGYKLIYIINPTGPATLMIESLQEWGSYCVVPQYPYHDYTGERYQLHKEYCEALYKSIEDGTYNP